MYERMLNKNNVPTYKEMIEYCAEIGQRFKEVNDLLSNKFYTITNINFPYGNKYGWCITHKVKSKLICNIFPECSSFSVMIRLTNQQFNSIYNRLGEYAKNYIDNKYPCNDGGWIHYRVTNGNQISDLITIITEKCNKNTVL